PRVRVAAGRARHHGRQAGGGRDPQARVRGAPRGARRRLRGRAPQRRDGGARRLRRRDRRAGRHAGAARLGARRARRLVTVLDGKRLLITGVITKDSIAFHVARRAQEQGARVVLTSFGRAMRLTERVAQRLPEAPAVLELDVNEPAHFDALAADLRERWDGVDGVLHAIAFAPEDALGGKFLTAPPESAEMAFRVSAYSLKALSAAVAPLMDGGGSVVGLDFDATVAWPIYDWMGVA